MEFQPITLVGFFENAFFFSECQDKNRIGFFVSETIWFWFKDQNIWG
jgi:hypothetical protein